MYRVKQGRKMLKMTEDYAEAVEVAERADKSRRFNEPYSTIEENIDGIWRFV